MTGTSQTWSQRFIVTREKLKYDEKIRIAEDEFLPMQYDNHKRKDGLMVFIYRPEKAMDKAITIKDRIPAANQVEVFDGHKLDMRVYRSYSAIRKSPTHYNSDLCTVFTRSVYRPGETIPFSELTPIFRDKVTRVTGFFMQNEQAYQDRIWKAIVARIMEVK